MGIETYIFDWRGITIEAVYDPQKWEDAAHLEVQSIMPPKAPLPITETGYLSYFHPIGSIEESGMSVVETLTFWLNERSRTKAWKAYEAASRQGDLFAG